MGLDMYLNKHYIDENGEECIEEIAYWRKANMIHKWFEDHVAGGNLENVTEYDVSRDQLIELAETCLAILKDPESASELMPTQDGFFFGSIDYSDFYFDDIVDTLKQISEVLASTDKNDRITYYAWW